MDGVIEKLGLYDFFGVFIPGMIILTLGVYIEIPFLNSKEYMKNDVIVVMIFILESYAIGIVLQEISSIFDNVLKVRKKARRTFLNNNKTIPNANELKEVIEVANEILEKDSSNNIFSEDECEYVFFKCKSLLEIKNMTGKAERINSLYAMSRGLAVSSLIAGIIIVCNMLYLLSTEYLGFFICTCIITPILFRRTSMYCKYYIRVVFRHYITLKKN